MPIIGFVSPERYWRAGSVVLVAVLLGRSAVGERHSLAPPSRNRGFIESVMAAYPWSPSVLVDVKMTAV
ncbi:MAG: hypothetical protein ACYCO9_08235 [Streptosporangiaceae bacterium]